MKIKYDKIKVDKDVDSLYIESNIDKYFITQSECHILYGIVKGERKYIKYLINKDTKVKLLDIIGTTIILDILEGSRNMVILIDKYVFMKNFKLL